MIIKCCHRDSNDVGNVQYWGVKQVEAKREKARTECPAFFARGGENAWDHRQSARRDLQESLELLKRIQEPQPGPEVWASRRDLSVLR